MAEKNHRTNDDLSDAIKGFDDIIESLTRIRSFFKENLSQTSDDSMFQITKQIHLIGKERDRYILRHKMGYPDELSVIEEDISRFESLSFGILRQSFQDLMDEEIREAEDERGKNGNPFSDADIRLMKIEVLKDQYERVSLWLNPEIELQARDRTEVKKYLDHCQQMIEELESGQKKEGASRVRKEYKQLKDLFISDDFFDDCTKAIYADHLFTEDGRLIKGAVMTYWLKCIIKEAGEHNPPYGNMLFENKPKGGKPLINSLAGEHFKPLEKIPHHSNLSKVTPANLAKDDPFIKDIPNAVRSAFNYHKKKDREAHPGKWDT